jgi:hypothetical protein
MKQDFSVSLLNMVYLLDIETEGQSFTDGIGEPTQILVCGARRNRATGEFDDFSRAFPLFDLVNDQDGDLIEKAIKAAISLFNEDGIYFDQIVKTKAA